MAQKGANDGANVPWKWRLPHSSWPQMEHCETSLTHLSPFSVFRFPQNLLTERGRSVLNLAKTGPGIDMDCLMFSDSDHLCISGYLRISQICFLRLRRCLKNHLPHSRSCGPTCLIQRYTAKHHIQDDNHDTRWHAIITMLLLMMRWKRRFMRVAYSFPGLGIGISCRHVCTDWSP